MLSYLNVNSETNFVFDFSNLARLPTETAREFFLAIS